MALVNSDRPELLDATDAEIEDALAFADPLALRGLLYQLTGDESLAAMPVTTVLFGWLNVAVLADPADVQCIRDEAAALLRAHRDRGAGPLEIGPQERLPKSLALVAGVEQIPERDIELWIEHLALDPWVRSLRWQRPPAPEQLSDFSVVVIGAGMAGLGAAVQLKQAGIDFTVIERDSGVGGTWWANRYPGARVDSPSRSYIHSFAASYIAPYPYCPQEENKRYFEWVADSFDVRDKIVFDTEVTSVVWDENDAKWEISAEGPDGSHVWRASVVISAVGIFGQANIPEIQGLGDFEGPSFHTAHWPSDLDLTGKRVAVIGTGCTGYQMVPELALHAGHVYAFQRTPQWVFPIPGYRSPSPPQVNWLDRNLPYYTNFLRFHLSWMNGPDVNAEAFDVDPEFDDPHAVSAHNKRVRDERIAFLQHKFTERPELVEKMIPQHPPMSARPVVVDEEYSIVDALLRDNVTLVTDGIERITATGIMAKDGIEYPVDAIVFATGFRPNDYLWPMEVVGHGGSRPYDLWTKDGPRAYLGAMLPGLPNFFMLYGPNTSPFGGGLSIVDIEETVTRFVLECVQHLILNDKRSIEVTEEAYWRYNATVDEYDSRKVYVDPRVTNYYRIDAGRSAVNCPIPANDMWHLLRRPNLDDMTVR